MAFEREKQNVSATNLLQAIASNEDIKLSQCVVTGGLDVNRLFVAEEKFAIDSLEFSEIDGVKKIVLTQSIVFDKCVFEDNVVFSSPWSDPDSISVEFKSDVVFNSSHFKAQGRFRNAVFDGMAGFDGCVFEGVATFKKSVFHKDAKFRTTIFDGYSLFDSAVFKSSGRFTNSHFAKGVNFTSVRFLGEVDFSGVYSSSRTVPIYESIFFARSYYGEDESFWRFVKQSAQEAGYYGLAGECFYMERCAGLWGKFRGRGNYDKLSSAKKILRLVSSVRLLPEFVLGKLLFGYGERPARVLFASALVIVLCAFYYSQQGTLIDRVGDSSLEPSFLRGLYFSTITFTTLGYGDFYPSADSFCRIVSMVEAVAGGSLIALFVVCLSKRFSRG